MNKSKLILLTGLIIVISAGITFVLCRQRPLTPKSSSSLTVSPQASIVPTEPNVLNYPVPSSWQRVSTVKNLSLCLPPKWEVDQWGNVYFNRDPGYRPDVTYISAIPYSGGSRREAYYQFWEKEYNNIRQTANVQEVNINGNTALVISEPGETVVWFAQGKLWQAGITGWSWVNDSKTAFLKDFLTMISCSF